MKNKLFLLFLLFISLSFGLLACSSSIAPKPIILGKEQCAYCKMTISDARFAAQLITSKGRTYNFDDVHCMIAFVNNQTVKKQDVAAFYLPDYNSNKLLAAENLFYLKSEELKSPMGGNLAAFENQKDRDAMLQKVSGTALSWEDLWK